MVTRSETKRASISTGADSVGYGGPIGERVVLRDGLSVVIRPLAAGDEATIASWFAGLGAETRYARFLAWLERVAARARAAWIERFIAVCLATNHPIIRLLTRLGPTSIGPSNGGLVDIRIDLTSTNTDLSASLPTGERRG